LEVEVMLDYVYLLAGYAPRFGVHRFVARIKGVSSHPQSLWTSSYCVATTGGASLEHVTRYIEGRKRSER